MKKFFISAIATLLFISCSSDDNGNSTSQNITPQALNNTLVNHDDWRVTLFEEDGDNHTGYFTGYTFTFDIDNVLTATNGTSTVNGTWAIIEYDDSDDDSPNSNPDFNLFFPSPDNFTELNEDWDVIQRTGNKVRFKHVSGGDGSIDYLTFER